jgi:hypothetical protein
MQPWTKDDLVDTTTAANQSEKDLAQVLVVNDARVYQPITESALVIPPESRLRKGTIVDRLYRASGERRKIDAARNSLAKKAAMKTLATEYRCTVRDIQCALDDLGRGYPLYGADLTHGQLRESEFDAFLHAPEDQREDEDLVVRDRSDEWRSLASSDNLGPRELGAVLGIAHLVRIDRLKAVKVFKGFTRLNGEPRVPPHIVGESDWLPAIELYGEGVFLALSEDLLKKWEKKEDVVSRLEKLRPRFVQSGRDDPNPLSPRFMLLHTLSHLLMRQIEAEGGYPAASLGERLYCAQAPKPMAAILIHVAVPDIAGSLGGLAELSEPSRFLGILVRALEHSRWCSLDPVCSKHEGQGPGLLNRAACHACALVPEPACEYGNALLDRGFVSEAASTEPPSVFGGT